MLEFRAFEVRGRAGDCRSTNPKATAAVPKLNSGSTTFSMAGKPAPSSVSWSVGTSQSSSVIGAEALARSPKPSQAPRRKARVRPRKKIEGRIGRSRPSGASAETT